MSGCLTVQRDSALLLHVILFEWGGLSSKAPLGIQQHFFVQKVGYAKVICGVLWTSHTNGFRARGLQAFYENVRIYL